MGRFRLGRCIGYGAKSVVFEAWRQLPDGSEQAVAIKRLAPPHAHDPVLLRLLCHEARVGQRVTHGHRGLVHVYELDRDRNDRPFLVMEHVDGVSLSALGPKPLPWPVAREVVRAVSDALVHVHGQGIVHRDVSPNNILISRDGEVRLTDFGFASLRDVHSELGVRGTAPYVSPEALIGASVDERTDLYSLGAVLYELVTGIPPFGTGPIMEIEQRINRWVIPLIGDDVPEDLRMVAMGLLQYEATDRALQSALAVRDALAATDGDLGELTELVEQALASRDARDDQPEEKTRFIEAPAILVDSVASTEIDSVASTERWRHAIPRRQRPRTWAMALAVVICTIGITWGLLWVRDSLQNDSPSREDRPAEVASLHAAYPTSMNHPVDMATASPGEALPLSGDESSLASSALESTPLVPGDTIASDASLPATKQEPARLDTGVAALPGRVMPKKQTAVPRRGWISPAETTIAPERACAERVNVIWQLPLAERVRLAAQQSQGHTP